MSFNRATESHFTNIDTTDAMIRHFKTMLPDAERVYFVVDALNECDDDFDSVVEFICDISLRLRQSQVAGNEPSRSRSSYKGE